MTQTRTNKNKSPNQSASPKADDAKITLEQKALKSKKWQLTIVNYTILSMNTFYTFVLIFLLNWGPAIVCGVTAILAGIAHLLIK